MSLRPSSPSSERPSSEAGQSIVLIALALVSLIAFVGIAVDVGLAFARSAALSAAVDAAALAGVTELHAAPGNAGRLLAHTRAEQFLMANGWPVNQAQVLTSTADLTESGMPQFTLTVTWPVELYFMRVLSFNQMSVTHAASAAYYARSDLYTTTAYESGMLRKAAQFVFGPNSCTRFGDPVTPLLSDTGVPNVTHSLTGGVYTYRIRIPNTYSSKTGTTRLRVELFDPDGYNNPDPSNATLVSHTNSFVQAGNPATRVLSCTGSPGIGQSCVVTTGENSTNLHQNPYWFVRVDESFAPGCPAGPDPTGSSLNNEPTYELYWFDANDARQTISRYTARIVNGPLTDLKWVFPGRDAGAPTEDGGRFEIDITPLPTDEFGYRYLYLDVVGSNSSKNVWDIWAGPPNVADALPDNINDRNRHLSNRLYALVADPTNAVPMPELGDVLIYAVGRMPLQTYVNGTLNLSLAPIGSIRGNSVYYTTVFDLDPVQTTAINFTLDTVSTADFNINASVIAGNPNPALHQVTCNGTTNCNNLWLSPQIRLPIPTVNSTPPVAFYGGALNVRYLANADAHTWFIALTEGRPFLTR